MPVKRLGLLASRLLSIVAEVRQTASSNLLIILISFGASVLAARLLGPEQRGALAAAVVYVTLASAIADAGLNQAVPYFAARRKPDAAAVLGTTCMLALLLGGVVAAAACALLVFYRVDSPGALFYLPSVPFSLLTTHLAAFMYGGGMLTQFNIVRVLQSALLLVALTVAALLGQPDVTAVLVAAVGLSVVLTAAVVLTLGRYVPFREWTIQGRIASGLLRYAVQSYLGNICWLFNSRLDQLVMSLVLPAAALGIYATAVSYAGVVFSFFSAFAMLAFAKASAVDGHAEDEIRAVIRHYARVSWLTGVPTAFAVAAAAPWLYPVLFGSDFEAGVAPAMILCAGSVFLGINYTLSNGMRIRNQPLRPSIAEAVGVVVSITGLIYVLPRTGIVGAAIVSLLSYVTVFGILLLLSRAGRGVPGDAVRSAS